MFEKHVILHVYIYVYKKYIYILYIKMHMFLSAHDTKVSSTCGWVGGGVVEQVLVEPSSGG